MIDVKMLNSIMGTGRMIGTIKKRTAITISSPRMLPKSRKVSDIVRANSPAISIGSIKNTGST